MEENDDYDAIRKKNIAERDEFFADFFKDLKKETAILKSQDVPRRERSNDSETENEPPKKRRKTMVRKESDRWTPGHVRLEFRKKYNTRNRAKKNESLSDSEDSSKEEDGKARKKNGTLKVLFPWAVTFERQISLMRLDLCDEENEEENNKDGSNSDSSDSVKSKKQVHRVLKSEYDPESIPSPDEITEEQLLNIAERSFKKTYCKVNGTSCHQCRQKTLDTKTVCRSGECIGVRGQFCGPCLRGRYGENAAVALKDPKWICPPCRGLCNCSICRTRNGQRPTGILAPVVQEEGFSSVMDYLESGNAGES